MALLLVVELGPAAALLPLVPFPAFWRAPCQFITSVAAFGLRPASARPLRAAPPKVSSEEWLLAAPGLVLMTRPDSTCRPAAAPNQAVAEARPRKGLAAALSDAQKRLRQKNKSRVAPPRDSNPGRRHAPAAAEVFP